MINNFYSYLSFTKINEKLYASTLSTLNNIDYKKIIFKIKIIKDTRKIKYAPFRKNNNNIPKIIGNRNKQRLLIRVENISNFSIPMEI
jgi:hypothetical protein